MRIRAEASVMTGFCLWLGALAGCGDDQSRVREPGAEATAKQVEQFDPALARNLPPNVDQSVAQQGRDLFIVCATCHGLDARGTELGPPLRDQEWLHISGELEEIERVIREGVAEPEEYDIPMPPGGGGAFDDAQVRAIAAYVYALSRSGAATTQP